MRDYIYLPDSAADGIYCSRCGEKLFQVFARREDIETWIETLIRHRTCKKEGEE
jgi:hypothetical protein